MVNYILADYKRVLGRIPRIVVLAVFELVFIFSVMSSWKNAAGTYTSVKLLESTSTFLGTSFMLFIGTMDFIQSFNYDFSAKTIQVAIGIGISRLQIIISKLIQSTLVILTDALVTIGIFFVLSFSKVFSVASLLKYATPPLFKIKVKLSFVASI